MKKIILAMTLLLVTGCVSQTRQEVELAINLFEICKEMAKVPQRTAVADKLSPKAANIDVVMMSDQRYPPEAELEAAKPYFRDRYACNRELVADLERINGFPEARINNLKLGTRIVENIVAEFLSGGITYGSYFTRLKNADADHMEREAMIIAGPAQQQSQRPSAGTSLFKPYCPPSKYPIYGCGNTSSSSNSSTRSLPSTKSCTYKSGPYTWSKTIKGYTCPATDSSGGYFGTLVR